MFYVSIYIVYYRHKLGLMSLFPSYTWYLSSFLVMFFVIFCMCEEISSRKFPSTSAFLLRLFKIFALFVRVLCVDFICCA